ncbi:zinc dependent phospholipase C family protein [Thermophilibacter immobilis]|uniref:Zinc dependent phospholipase C family protein n=1 Tax=Thermophilibacter immobilis TaxID=2779519 RepID=A0A7S7M9K8_9ACTN|nr:zinc dependent phospholipase C family protein [Thermophilibacter immobilis]QOY61229.1 zinc dependent phospholipase C family protein [Thermophilibacter immobilis]
MPALITHHIFGEDVASTLPHGVVAGEEELLAFLLGNQGVDPFFARFSTLPHVARACHRLASRMRSGHVLHAFLTLRDGVGRLPSDDERIGRAFALGVMGHYALDRATHPFVSSQQRDLVMADPSLAASAHEVRALIESDLDTWLLWEKRAASVEERPAATSLMRTARVERVGGALLSQVALAVFGLSVGAGEYAEAVRDYEQLYTSIEGAGSPRARATVGLARLGHAGACPVVVAHRACHEPASAAANLERRPWRDVVTDTVRHDSFADLFEEARLAYPALAETLVRGDEGRLRQLVGGLDYEGRHVVDD